MCVALACTHTRPAHEGMLPTRAWASSTCPHTLPWVPRSLGGTYRPSPRPSFQGRSGPSPRGPSSEALGRPHGTPTLQGVLPAAIGLSRVARARVLYCRSVHAGRVAQRTGPAVASARALGLAAAPLLARAVLGLALLDPVERVATTVGLGVCCGHFVVLRENQGFGDSRVLR
jgi:hypothetical protein